MNRFITHQRRRAARILLAVFLPMLLLASLHHHDLTVVMEDTTCYACQHHLHHNGHLTANLQHISNCVLCQFLTLPYLSAPAVNSPTPCNAPFASPVRYTCHTATRPHPILNPRAPPAFLAISPLQPTVL